MVPATALPGRLADMLGPPCFQHASPHEPAIRPAIAATRTRSIEPILPVSPPLSDTRWERQLARARAGANPVDRARTRFLASGQNLDAPRPSNHPARPDQGAARLCLPTAPADPFTLTEPRRLLHDVPTRSLSRADPRVAAGDLARPVLAMRVSSLSDPTAHARRDDASASGTGSLTTPNVICSDERRAASRSNAPHVRAPRGSTREAAR